ncbi:MAG: hypothetical protein Q4P14_02710, partial [Methanobacteriaceae archaeon]|nr:hypothetical protein [Methanobacteriaceae archaeon]
ITVSDGGVTSIYTPYIYTKTNETIALSDGGDIEFVTNAFYTNDSDVIVKVDGALLTLNKDYELSHGSTHVKLKSSYLNNLSAKTYTLTIAVTGYDDIDTSFTIVGSSLGSGSHSSSTAYVIPKTGIK